MKILSVVTAILFSACTTAATREDPPDNGDDTAALESARSACVMSCDAIVSATGCTDATATAAQADECRATCATQLESTVRCAPAGEAMWICLDGAQWVCSRNGSNASPPDNACLAESAALRACILGN